MTGFSPQGSSPPAYPVEDAIRISQNAKAVGWTKFGHKDDLAAASGEQTIWPVAVDTPTFLTSASTFNIAYDGTGGGTTEGSSSTGARELTFFYIDSSGLPATATHTLGADGTDTTSFSGLGINRIAVTDNGGHAGKANVSAITVTATTGGSTQAIVPAGEGVTDQAIFFVGSNHDAVAKFLSLNSTKKGGGTPTVTFKAYAYNRAIDSTYEVFRYDMDTNIENHINIIEPVGFNLSPTDVLWFVADTDTNSTIANVRFSLVQYER